MEMLQSVIVLVFLGLIYWLPGVVAVARGNKQSLSIIILNTLLGWTVLGWIVALIWACANKEPGSGSAGAAPTERRPCPHCAEMILPAAKVCPFCKSSLVA